MSSVNDILKSNLNDIKKLDEFLKLENVDDSISNEDFCTYSSGSDEEINDNLEVSVLQDNIISGNFDSRAFDLKVSEILDHRNIHESVLALNNLQQSLLRHHINKFENLLDECRKKLKLIKRQISLESAERNRKPPTFYKLGVPFFKDECLRFPPPNLDVIKKKQNDEISLVDLPFTKLWVKKDKEILLDEVQLQSKQIRIDMVKEQLQPFIALYKTVKDEKKKRELKTKIDTLQAELLSWQKKKPGDCVFPLEEKHAQIDWLKISATDLAGRHEDDECKAMWYMYLHPSINKSSWGVKENEKLREIAQKYNYQDWDKIAIDLGTSRSGYQCCLQCQLKIKKKKNNEKWTPEEDAYLLEVVDSCRIGNYIPWGKVSYYIKGRNKSQVYTRYAYTLMSGIKKGKFTKAEDAKLLNLVKEHGTKFSKIALYLPNRTSIQLRDRYNMVLKFDKKTSGTWLIEEDQQILEHVKEMGENQWSALFKKFQSKTARNRANLRHRWITLKKFLEKNPDANLDNAPRKHRSKKNSNKRKTVIDETEINYKSGGICIDSESVSNFTEENISCKTSQKYSKNVSQDLLGKKFVHFFVQTYKFIKLDSRTTSNIEKDIEHIIFIFRCIHVNLSLNTMNQAVNNKNKELSEYDQTLLFALSSKLETILPLDFVNTSSDDLLSLTPKSFLNIFSVQNFILNCKLLLKSFVWLWHDSELENFCVKVYDRYMRIFDNEDVCNAKNILKPTHTNIKSKDCASNIKCLPIVENESLVNTVVKVEYQSDFIHDSTKFTILNKRQSEDMFKRRCISLFTLPCYKNFIVEVLNEYDIESKKKLEQNDEPVSVKNKSGRKRGRPVKVLPGKRLKYAQKVHSQCSNIDSN